jgi:ADP-ribose pyrophosphatase YjhB (NUDIX family)
MINRLNVRVYFFLLDDTSSHVLVSDEIIQKEWYTKFPGGGLEFGEGTLDAAMREAMEELGQAIEVTDHLYTTDFFIQSAFRESDQIMSIYYLAKLAEPQRFSTANSRFDFVQFEKNEERFRWVEIGQLVNEEFQFPTDRKAVEVFLKRIGLSH